MADLRTDYLRGDARVLPFAGRKLPAGVADFADMMGQRKAFAQDRDALADALLAQYEGVADADSVRARIQSLRSEKTFTVTTGHQLCLWGGPLFFTYKILTVIRMTEELQRQFPDHQFVPVFWMASEDHDAAEANHFHRSFHEKVTYAGNFRGAVGRHIVEPSFLDTLPDSYQTQFASCFEAGERYATGFRRFVHQLFGALGMVVLDGDDPRLKALFRPIVKRELESQFAAKAVSQTNSELLQAGYGLQAHPREINLFLLEDGFRERIERVGGEYRLADSGTIISAAEMEKRVEAHPEQFSPNVILRPLYQEMILPNLAYVGGWGEFAYWMQLGGVFREASVPFPALMPRYSANLFPAHSKNELKSMGLEPLDLTAPMHTLQEKIARSLWDFGPTEAALARLQQSYDEVLDTLHTLDPTLERSFKGLQVEVAHRGDHLMAKVRKSVRNRFPAAFALPESLRQQWFARQPQERELSLFSTGMSPNDFISLVHSQLDPFQTQGQWILLP